MNAWNPLILLMACYGVIILAPKAYQRQQFEKQINRLHLKNNNPDNDLGYSLLGSILSRIKQLVQNYIPQKRIERLKQTIVVSHRPGYSLEKHFIYMGLCSIFLATTTTFLLIELHRPLWPPFIVTTAIIGLFLPGFFLKNMIKKLHSEILQELPQFINVLRVCVEAGLDLESAFKKLTENYHGVLLVETKILLHEISLGKSLGASLQSMAQRIDLPEMTALLSLVIQSTNNGISIVDTLRIQADGILHQQMQNTREKAAKTPTLMTIPLVFFILPAVIILTIGPAALSLKNTLL